ncbi:hypothetical protein AB0F11_27700 [Streptomyces sp. NPDC032472]|uniref:hypothetical protein n=1 Tax=Streptomyces sp. NPDC032472 TaxID=3155018 RepID=UPI0033DEC197
MACDLVICRGVVVLLRSCFPKAVAAFPLVRNEIDTSTAGVTCRVVYVVEVPDAIGDGAAGRAVTSKCPGPVRGAAPGSVVPVWRAELDVAVLAPDYRRIMGIVAGGGTPVDCRQLAAALGLEPVPAKVEGVRSKAERLAARDG